MTTSRTTLPKRKLYPLVTAGMLLMAVVLLLIALDYTSMGLLLLGYGVGVHALIRGGFRMERGHSDLLLVVAARSNHSLADDLLSLIPLKRLSMKH